MNELVYARSPSPGKVEIVISNGEKDRLEVYPLSDESFAALFDVISSAAGKRLGVQVSPPRKSNPTGVARHGMLEGLSSREMVNDDPEGMIWTPWGLMKDKSKRIYGTRPA